MPFLSRTPYTPPPYAEMAARNALMEGTTEASYNASVANLAGLKGMEVSAITYESDGTVTGIEVLPTLQPGEKIPLLIYNRGGSGDYGMLSPGQITVLMAPFVQRLRCGVLASNYRGNGGGEGSDSFGGDEVNDVLRLIELGKEQEWWDGKNIFMLGWSRGGMMAYLAMKHGAQLTAVAVGAGMADLTNGGNITPAMEDLYQRRMPDYAARGEAALLERSAVQWPEKISAPLLLLHGDADPTIDVSEARLLYAKLQALGHPVKYVEYPGGDHALRKQWKQWVDETVAWFEQYRR